VDLTPKWAKAAAVLGLRLNIMLAYKRGELTEEERYEYNRLLAEIEDMK
jgi:hypothetical protein